MDDSDTSSTCSSNDASEDDSSDEEETAANAAHAASAFCRTEHGHSHHVRDSGEPAALHSGTSVADPAANRGEPLGSGERSNATAAKSGSFRWCSCTSPHVAEDTARRAAGPSRATAPDADQARGDELDDMTGAEVSEPCEPPAAQHSREAERCWLIMLVNLHSAMIFASHATPSQYQLLSSDTFVLVRCMSRCYFAVGLKLIVKCDSSERHVETWMLMEYCEMGSLHDWLQAGKFKLPSGHPNLPVIVACLFNIASGNLALTCYVFLSKHAPFP